MEIRKLPNRIAAYLRELGNLTPIALVTTFLPFAGSAVLISVSYPLGHWLRDNWETGTPLYLLGVFVFCGLALLPTNVIGLIGGWAFGFGLGIVVLIAGIVGAALMSFLIHQRIVGERLPHVFDAHPKAKAIYDALVGQSVWRTTLIITLLRLSPAMPFALTNFLMASSRVPLRSFVVGTFFGMLPRSSAVVLVGSGLSELTLSTREDTWLLIFGIAATIVSVIVIGKISKHALERLTSENQAI
jgi:uncharacterized membrane protein YdjX (TVP38/TMEM64 family)